MVSFELTIASGATVSDALNRSHLRHAKDGLTIIAPPSFGTGGVIQVEVTDKMVPVTADWADLQTNGVDVTLTADKAPVLLKCPYMGLRLKSASTPGTALVFGVIINDVAL